MSERWTDGLYVIEMPAPRSQAPSSAPWSSALSVAGSVGSSIGAWHASGVAWLVSDARVLASAEVATDRRDRRRGLLGRDGMDGAFVITGCRWVHTIGMRFPLDVAYLDDDGVVVKIAHMARHRIGVPVSEATWVVEAAAGAFERWGLAVGAVVELRQHADGAAAGPPP